MVSEEPVRDERTRALQFGTVAAEYEQHRMGYPFEQFTSNDRFDLLFAAAAWHWTDPRTRWERAHALLAPGGMLAFLGRPCDPVDAALTAAIDDVMDRHSAWSDGPAAHWWSFDDLAESVDFTDPVEQHLRSSLVISADAYLRRLATTSGYWYWTPAIVRPSRARSLPWCRSTSRSIRRRG